MTIAIPPRGTRGVTLPAVARVLMRWLSPVMVFSFRRFGGRMRIQGRPLVLLETRGARTGKVRRTVLARFEDPRGIVVVASNTGAAAHPSWFINLARNPEQVWIETDGKRQKVRPESLRGAEREEVWRRVVSLAPGYTGYRTQTDREIPIVRLVPE